MVGCIQLIYADDFARAGTFGRSGRKTVGTRSALQDGATNTGPGDPQCPAFGIPRAAPAGPMFYFPDRAAAQRRWPLVSWCYRDCSPSGRDCRPVRKIPCFHGHGNSRRCRPHFAPSVPSAGRMSLSTVNRGTGSGFQPNFSIWKADLHVSVRDTQSSKRHKYGILIGPPPPRGDAT